MKLVIDKIKRRCSELELGDAVYKRLAGGAFWSILGSGIAQCLGLVVSVLCARWLGKAEYGQLGIILSTVNLFVIFAAMGLGVTATKHVAQYRKSEPHRAGKIIGVSSLVSTLSGLVVVLVVTATAPRLAEQVLHAPQLSNLLRIGAVMIFFAAVNGSQIGALSGFEAFRELAIANLVRGILSFPVVVAGVYFAGLQGAVMANALMSLVNFVVHHVILRLVCKRHKVVVSYSIEKADLRLLWKFSVPVLISGFSFTPAVWCSNAMLANNSSFAQSGVFTAAFQWQNVIMFVANAVANLGLPMLSSVVAEKDGAKYLRYLKLNFLLTSGLATAVAIPLAAASPWIMSAYGKGYEEGAATLMLVCLSTVLSAMNISVGHAIWSLNAARSGMVLAFVRGLSLVGAAYFLTHRGAVGLALSYVVMASVQTCVQVPFMFWLLKKHFGSLSRHAQRCSAEA